jgi:hypothetical protein
MNRPETISLPLLLDLLSGEDLGDLRSGATKMVAPA